MILNLSDTLIWFACSSVGKKFEVPVENGLNEETALEILSLYVNGKAQKLPEQARSIVSECKGRDNLFYAKTFLQKHSPLKRYEI